ncbi:hypothetical protein CC80DRAFT_504935 [Byssothecium circinans]|uniref:Uncharacterized protein n=1 Tax=Byssothecium circinans TaxID=147558 RepID=A0A6A5TTU7_9PLEO|nr:hypothetical protein CC80DRAFT_504935 [Byssothecium circinans]
MGGPSESHYLSWNGQINTSPTAPMPIKACSLQLIMRQQIIACCSLMYQATEDLGPESGIYRNFIWPERHPVILYYTTSDLTDPLRGYRKGTAFQVILILVILVITVIAINQTHHLPALPSADSAPP